MLKRYLILAAAAAFLAGCSSNPPVEGSGSGANSSANQGAQSAVAPVQAAGAGAEAQGPVGVPRVIYFDFNKYNIKPEYQSVVDAQGRFLATHPDRHVTLEGNTDPRGSAEYNLALGQKRADAVAHALELVGAQPNQVEAVSFGKENLASPGTTEADYAKDRRVEFHYR